MKQFLNILILITLSSCTFGVTVHDEDRAAELARQFLFHALLKDELRSIYEQAHVKFKESVTFEKLSEQLSYVRKKIPKSPIRIVGYEIYGGKEAISVYAESKSTTLNVFYKLTYIGTKSKDYQLLNFNLYETEIEKNGMYRILTPPIRIDNV